MKKSYGIKDGEYIEATSDNLQQLSQAGYIFKYREDIVEEFYNDFNKALDVITGVYSENEQKTFELKRKEADIVLGGGESSFLSSLTIEGETILELANKIKQNSEGYKVLYANAEKVLRENLNKIN